MSILPDERGADRYGDDNRDNDRDYNLDDFKQIPVGDIDDIEKLVAGKSHSSHSPQERELEEEDTTKSENRISKYETKETNTRSPKQKNVKFNIAQLLSLSHQQLKVFLCKTAGLSNRESAKLMEIGESTVREHWKTVKKKLNTPSPEAIGERR